MMGPVMCEAELSPKMDVQKERMKYLLANAIHELWKKETGSLSSILIEGTICITSSSGKTTVVQVSDRFVSQLANDGLCSPFDPHYNPPMVSPALSRISNSSSGYLPLHRDHSSQFSPSESNHSYVSVQSPMTEESVNETPRSTPSALNRDHVKENSSLMQTPHREVQKSPVKRELISEDSDSETELVSPETVQPRSSLSPKKRASNELYQLGAGSFVPGTGVYVNACDTRGCIVNSDHRLTDSNRQAHQRMFAGMYSFSPSGRHGSFHGLGRAASGKLAHSELPAVDLSRYNDASPPKMSKKDDDSLEDNNNDENINNNNIIPKNHHVSHVAVVTGSNAPVDQDLHRTLMVSKSDLSREQGTPSAERKDGMSSKHFHDPANSDNAQSQECEDIQAHDFTSPDAASRQQWAPVVYDRSSLKLTIEATPPTATPLTVSTATQDQPVFGSPPVLSSSCSPSPTSITMVTAAAQGLMSLSTSSQESAESNSSGSAELQAMLKRRSQLPALLRARVLANQQAAAAAAPNGGSTQPNHTASPHAPTIRTSAALGIAQPLPKQSIPHHMSSLAGQMTSPSPLTSPNSDVQSTPHERLPHDTILSPPSPSEGSPESDKSTNGDVVGEGRLDANGEQRSYKCNFCGKIFHFKSKYHEHLPVHTNARPYQCHLCSRTYKYKYDLRVHLRTHMGIPTKSSVCPFCSQKCDSNKLLRLHIKEHHQDQQKISEAECSTEEMSPAL